MEPLATLNQVREIDYQSRRDRCLGLITPAAQLFAKHLEVKKAIKKGVKLHAPLAVVVVGLILHFVFKDEGRFEWTFGVVVAAYGYFWGLSRYLNEWLQARRAHELDEQLSLMSALWTGAGASRQHFYQLGDFLQDGAIDFDSAQYKRWFREFDEWLQEHCGLKSSYLDKALHQLKKSA